MIQKLSMALVALAALATNAWADFSYSYGHPQTPLTDGYIVSTSNVGLYSEGSVRLWKPNVGGGTFASTTPGVVVYHFGFDRPSAAIDLWMNMPTFHWSYSRGHNRLFGSTDGSDWEMLADVPPPAFGQARDLGTVDIPDSLLGANDLWLRVELYSYGSSAHRGDVFTNTSQLSRYDVNANNTSFRLNVTSVPEPTMALLPVFGLVGLCCLRRQKR